MMYIIYFIWREEKKKATAKRIILFINIVCTLSLERSIYCSQVSGSCSCVFHSSPV